MCMNLFMNKAQADAAAVVAADTAKKANDEFAARVRAVIAEPPK